MDTFDNRGGTLCHTDGVLTCDSGANKTITTTTSYVFDIKGKKYTKTAVTNEATPTTDGFTTAAFVALANLYSCIFVWCRDSSGASKVCQGPVVLTTDVSNGSKALQFPSIPDTLCPVSYMTMSHANATSFTFGTGNFNQTGLTLGAVIPVGQLPTVPLTAVT